MYINAALWLRFILINSLNVTLDASSCRLAVQMWYILFKRFKIEIHCKELFTTADLTLCNVLTLQLVSFPNYFLHRRDDTKKEEEVAVGSLSFGSLRPSFIHAHFFMLWKSCICQTIRGSVPRRPLFSEIPCCFDASIDLQPIRHQERWRDYWCNISEFIAEWGTSGRRSEVRLLVWEQLFTCSHKFVAVS